MSTVLLLVVLAGWIGVGFWWFVGHRGAPSDAIGSFRRQLGTLERRSPHAVQPAHRLGQSRTYGAVVAPRRAAPTAMHRAHVQRRRRDILAGLALTSAATLLLGVYPPLRLLWVVSLLSGALLAGYCYLLVQLKTVAAEREMQVRFRTDRAPAHVDGTVYALADRPARRRPVEGDLGYGAGIGYRNGYEPALLRRNAG